MPDIPATEFKAKCLDLMDRVAERHEIYVITKRGKPVAKLVPVEPDPQDSIFGWLRARGTIQGDILSPSIPLQNWDSLREWDELNGVDEPQNTSTVGGSRKKQRSRR